MTESYFELVIRVSHDEMAQWPQERLAAFFQAVGVVMAAKSQAPLPSPPQAVAPSADGESAGPVDQRLKRIEETVDGVRRHVASLHESMAADFRAFEDNLVSQSNAIQSTRTAMSQTDDLVERVVDAIEALQSAAVHPTDESALNIPVN
jgi:hypothetical protein